MRRTDREVADVQKMKVILDRCKIVSYAMWDGEKPYAVIMNFGYEFTPEGKLRLYSHSALDGKKVSIIRGICNKVAAIMECGERVVIDPEIPCKSGSAFQSIMANGTMKILQGSEARHALEVFYRHQTGVVPSFPEEGWQVLFGHNDIFPKLEQALMGKKARDTVTLTLEPEDAFGESEPELIRSVPLNLLGDNVEPGMKVEGVPGEPSDGRFYTVIGSDENHVFLDGNHPFAGWALKFVVRVLKVEKATPEEVEEMEAPELLEVADLVKEASETKH